MSIPLLRPLHFTERELVVPDLCFCWGRLGSGTQGLGHEKTFVLGAMCRPWTLVVVSHDNDDNGGSGTGGDESPRRRVSDPGKVKRSRKSRGSGPGIRRTIPPPSVIRFSGLDLPYYSNFGGLSSRPRVRRDRLK